MLYDCFIFFNELDVLELRLRELQDVVDRFVLVEASVTFSGHPKPLLFAEHYSRFRAWKDKIVHVVVDDLPLDVDSWARERHQRNSIRQGLQTAGAGDTVIISDADEIPRADAIRRWRPELGPCRFEQLFCYYWINCVGGNWTGSRILPYQDLATYSDINEIRHLQCPVLKDGGWHFSYLGGPDAIRTKLEAFSHQDLNIPRFKDPRYLSHVVSLGMDLFGRNGMEFTFQTLDDRFPACVRNDPKRFEALVCNARFNENWYPADQLLRLGQLCESVADLPGAILEIGSWEGRSTVVLAGACYPNTLVAIDTWDGNIDESPTHSTVQVAKRRNVYAQFVANMQALTQGNVRPVRIDCHSFLKSFNEPIKFAHIDASHDYDSVKRTIEALIPCTVQDGILCGDDFLTASCTREDLSGGVERAVKELLIGFKTAHNLWWWRKP
jgi:beta-1,4-mannosyl-glycoprotein beta-1,4-N-acetylglucosaminyltransferase